MIKSDRLEALAARILWKASEGKPVFGAQAAGQVAAEVHALPLTERAQVWRLIDSFTVDPAARRTVAIAVGTRELKNRLSYYLRRVQDGEPIFVTDRGAVVAELRTARPKKGRARKSDRAVLLELAAEGSVTLGTGRLRDRPPLRFKPGKSLSTMVVEDRR